MKIGTSFITLGNLEREVKQDEPYVIRTIEQEDLTEPSKNAQPADCFSMKQCVAVENVSSLI